MIGVKLTLTILVFSKTAAYRHEAIPDGIQAIDELGKESGYSIVATEDAGTFTDENLARFDAVVFLMTTGDVLDSEQQAAFERFMKERQGLRRNPFRIRYGVRLAFLRKPGRRLLSNPPRDPAGFLHRRGQGPSRDPPPSVSLGAHRRAL